MKNKPQNCLEQKSLGLEMDYVDITCNVDFINHSSDTSILLIDGIVEEAGPELTTLWQREDEASDGFYPPPSLHVRSLSL